MNPTLLVDNTLVPPLPAPVWFIELFKMLGFTLHEVPMNLWYAGIITATVLYAWGSENGRRFSGRLMTQMPIIIAMGINFGIVPLLFIQVGYAKLFYPATVLMAWFWFSVIVLLIPAYYGVYVYAFGLKDEKKTMARWKQAAGWVSAFLFLVIGFFFANALSLMENWKSWTDLWQQHSIHGAALGTALNAGADVRFWPRWLLMFGLALATTGAWAAFDSAWFATREKPEYRQWAKDFALRLYTLGAAWFLVAGAGYSLGTWSPEVKRTMLLGWGIPLTLLTVAAPAGPWYLLWRARQQPGEIDRRWASFVGAAQFGVLAINAISRQVVQNLEVRGYYNIFDQATSTQWSALAVFLISFVVGAAIVAWLIWQVAKLPAEPEKV